MAVATYHYYKKVRRTMRTAIVSNLLNVTRSYYEIGLSSRTDKRFFETFVKTERKNDQR